MAKEKKVKEPKIKKVKKQRNPFKDMAGVIIVLLLAVGSFLGLTYAQKYLTNDIILTNVIVAKVDIPENTTITEENASTYFTKAQVSTSGTPSNALASLDGMAGFKTSRAISKNTVITPSDFANASVGQKIFEDPVETSINISSIADIVAGKVRAGDVINLTVNYTIDKTSPDYKQSTTSVISSSSGASGNATPVGSKFNQVILKDVYVTAVYDTSGVKIETNDSASNAAVLVFTIERADEENLNKALANASGMRISRTLKVGTNKED